MTSHLSRLYRYVSPAGVLAAICLASLTTPTVARADEGGAGAAAAPEVKAPPPPKKWDGTVTAGATLTRGNSENFLASGILTLKRSWTNNEALFGASAGYGETTTKINGTNVNSTTESYVRGFGQFNHLFTPKLYAGLRVTGEHDDVAALAYRFTVSPLAGYYFVKQTNAFLAAEVGPSYVNEKFFNESADDYIGLRIGERGEYKFNNGAKVWESLEYIPKVEDFSNFLLNAEAGVSAPLTKTLSLSLVMQDTYKSVPAIGKVKNDFKLIAGVTYSF